MIFLLWILTSLNQERFIEWVNAHDNVHWVPMIEMARDFRIKKAPSPIAKMPLGYKQGGPSDVC